MSNGPDESSAPDLTAVRADDALLDALGGSDRKVADELGASELNSLLLSWSREVDSEPIPELVDTETAVATIRAAKASHKGSRERRRRLLIPVAAAAAVLGVTFGGASIAARDAQPGDTLWGLTQVLYADKAASVEASYDVRAEFELARDALDDGDLDMARDALDKARESLDDVAAEEDHDGLQHQHDDLRDELGSGGGSDDEEPSNPGADDPSSSDPASTTTPSEDPSTQEPTTPPGSETSEPTSPTTPPTTTATDGSTSEDGGTRTEDDPGSGGAGANASDGGGSVPDGNTGLEPVG